MICKNITMVMGLILLSTQQGWALTLHEYKAKVRRDSLQVQQLSQENEAAKLESRSADLIFTPSFFANAQILKDEAYANPPLLTYDRFDSDQYSLGVQQQFNFGLQAKLSYQITKTNYINSPMSATTNLNFTDAKPVLELSLPLWKNGFGRSAKAQEEAIRAQSMAQHSLSEAQITRLDIEAESLYWRCSAAKEAVEVQTQSLKSAEGIKAYVTRKANMELGENSDVIQAAALVEARKLQLLQAENEARAAAQALNALMNINSDEMPQEMEKIDSKKVFTVNLSVERPGHRADVVAAQAQMRAAQANSISSAENVRPTLDLYGSYAMNGRGDDIGDAGGNISSDKRDTQVVGVRFSMPLNLGAESDVIRSARLRSNAAATSYQKALFEQEVAWKELIRKLNESKLNLKMALSVEKIQGQKLELEKKRLRQGRTTTYQVLLFEQDYLDAQLGRIQNAAQILSIESQSKAYESNSGPGSEGGAK